MPACIRGRADALLALDNVEVDHRLSTVGVALLTSLQAGGPRVFDVERIDSFGVSLTVVILAGQDGHQRA
jgi:hypothetical protein